MEIQHFGDCSSFFGVLSIRRNSVKFWSDEKRWKIANFCRILSKNPKMFQEILLNFWNWSGAKDCKSCRDFIVFVFFSLRQPKYERLSENAHFQRRNGHFLRPYLCLHSWNPSKSAGDGGVGTVLPQQPTPGPRGNHPGRPPEEAQILT